MSNFENDKRTDRSIDPTRKQLLLETIHAVLSCKIVQGIKFTIYCSSKRIFL